MKDFLARDKLDKPGVYILAGTDPESNAPAVYIGEAESVIDGVLQAILKVMDAFNAVDTAYSANRPNNETAEAW